LPDHAPSRPVNGRDWAWLADIDNISAALTAAALANFPNKLESKGFISGFPFKIDVPKRNTSRLTEDLVSPRCVWFK
jgi:hypothetical protein